jgi:DNA ligase-4
LNPLPKLSTRNPTAMLRLKSNAGPAQLELYAAMRCWDSRMGKLYSTGKGDMDWCADTINDMRDGEVAGIGHGPIVGVNVQVRLDSSQNVDNRSLNVGKVDHAKMHSKHLQTLDHPVVNSGLKLNMMDTGMSTICEVLKSRMQIHVKVSDDGQVDITIFSKSKRNSTQDRLNTHS